MQWGHGVADGALRVLAHFLHSLHGVLEVAGIVERVENPEDVHAVFSGFFNKLIDDAVFVVTVSQKVLAAKQHLKA